MKSFTIAFLGLLMTYNALASSDPCEKAAQNAAYKAQKAYQKTERGYTFNIGDASITRPATSSQMGLYEVEYNYNDECVGSYMVGVQPSEDGNSCQVKFVRDLPVDGACG